MFFIFAYFARCGEVICTVLTALNRMTAIILQFRHIQIWSTRSQILCFSYQISMGILLGVMVILTSESSWNHASDGNSYQELHQSQSATLLLFGVLASSIAFISAIIILYALSYFILRTKLRIENQVGQSPSKSERSLTYVAVLNCGVEIDYYAIFAYVFIIARDFE
ncbi:hypothetical protein PENTCL1PPCAC_17156, partial [Pristionchus entomophagus]